MQPEIKKLLCNIDTPLQVALAQMNEHAQGINFIVSGERLIGTLTDGDIRRYLLRSGSLDKTVQEAMNARCVSLPVHASQAEIQARLTRSITHIPLVDADNRPVDYACTLQYRRIPVLETSLAGNELAYVTEAVKSGWISSKGRFVGEFEANFAKYNDMPHGVAVANGTVGLHLALATLGIGPGDEVIVPDYTFAASINAIIYTGADPVLVDVKQDDWNIDPEKVAAAVTKKTKAIMPVHIYGQPCDIEAISRIAKQHNLFVVSDAAEAVGSEYHGKPVGAFGDVSVFSFYGNKTITTGEGGMVLFHDSNLHERALVLRDHGMSKQRRYWHEQIGFNYRMTNLQAGIGLAQLERIGAIVEKKRAIKEIYDMHFREFPGVVLQKEAPHTRTSNWLYTLLLTKEAAVNRNELLDKLLLRGIEGRPGFGSLHEMPPYRRFAGRDDFFHSKTISENALSLPSSVTLSPTDVHEIADTVLELIDTCERPTRKVSMTAATVADDNQGLGHT